MKQTFKVILYLRACSIGRLIQLALCLFSTDLLILEFDQTFQKKESYAFSPLLYCILILVIFLSFPFEYFSLLVTR